MDDGAGSGPFDQHGPCRVRLRMQEGLRAHLQGGLP